MEGENLQRELSVLLCHYLKLNFPNIYTELVEHCEKQNLLPEKCATIEEALTIRYSNFPQDHFFRFIKTLRPDDDFPSIFRRLKPFKEIKVQKNYFLKPEIHCKVFMDAITCSVTDSLSRIMVIGSSNGTIKMFTLPNFEYVKRFIGHENSITSLLINPSCTILLSASSDKTIKLWSLSNGKLISTLSGFTYGEIKNVAFAPTGSMIAVACDDGTVQLWTMPDAMQGKLPCRILKAPSKGPAENVAFSPGGEFFAFSAEPNSLSIVPMKSMTPINLEGVNGVTEILKFTHLSYGNDEIYCPRLLAVSFEDGAVTAFQLEGTQWKQRFQVRQGVGRSKARILTVGEDHAEHYMLVSRMAALFKLDIITGEIVGQFPDIPVCEEVTVIAGNPKLLNVFFIGNASGDAALVDSDRMIIMSNANIGASISKAVWNADGDFVFVMDSEGFVHVFGIADKAAKSDCPRTSLFELSEFGHNDEGLCDENGKVLDDVCQIDIRDLSLPIKVLQSAFLRACAAEIAVIQKLSETESTTQEETSADVSIAPPLHIPLTIDYPSNPCGPNAVFESDTLTEAEEDGLEINIVSDEEEWKLDPQTGEDDPVFFKTVSSSESQYGNWPIWSTAVIYEETSYLPQVGDDVFFIKQAYAKMLEDEGINAEVPPNASLEKPTRCTITDITMSDVGMNVSLVIRSNEINVVFPVPEPVPFIILIPRYKAALEALSNLKIGDRVMVPYEDDDAIKGYRGEVFKINADAAERPFESITVKWDSGDETAISPWEIYEVNDTKIRSAPPAISPIAQVSAISVVDTFISNPQNSHFVSLKSIPKRYVPNIILPMSLKLFRERLENVWYRSTRAMGADLGLLIHVASVMHGETSKEAAAVTTMVDTLTANLEKAIKTLSAKRKGRKPEEK